MSTFRLSRLSACLLLAASPPLYAETSQSNPPRSLETIDVTAAPSGGDYDAGMTTEGKDSYTTDATNTATRMVLSPRETPQSVTVITREQMEDFGLNSVAEVMQRTPGVTVNAQDTERLQFFARGFEITNFLYDGMPSMRNSSLGKQAAQADTFIYDRVEVLRGASGLLHGIGNPSATINLVRKKPTRDFSGQVGVEANSWNGYRGELDVGGPIDGHDKVRARFVSAYEQGESFLDHYENEKQVFYGVIEGDISDSTMITLGMDYMDYDPQGSTWGGIPLFYSDGGIADLDRDTNPATDWSSWAQDARTAFMHLEHQFDSGWYGKLAYTYQENNYDAQLASAGGGTLNRDGSGKTLWSGRFQEEKHQDTFDLYANGPFELFGRQHELVVGASHSRAKRDYTGQPALNFDNTLDNLFTWDGNRAKPAWGANNAEEKELIEQTGFYATSRFKPTDSLAVITGGRVVDWERSRSGFNWAGPFPDHERHFEENGEVVPFAGVVYDLNQHHSVYASYTSIFQPQTARDMDNRVLDPEEGNSYEAGLKSEFRNGRVNTTVAVFRTDQDNLAESTGQPIPGGPANSVAYRAVDGAQTNGFELEASGEILPRWQLLAGYTYRITEDPEGDELNTTSPEDMLRLSTRYRFNGSLDGLTLGTSIAWQNKTYAFVTRPGHSGDFKFVQDAYTLVDLMARYQFNPALSVTANVSNLTDETYFNNLGFYNGGYYGDGRKASLKLNYRF
ncbi:MAG: outer membrane receptor for ferric coprogen and ferric-rhodotorulic acid [Alcanivorax sp.]|jgi:outer membrane receptor for ferric coprogen and ferric-rhodotorulic acid|uniref:TonB-dependent siderophore receptor n=1 Tax=Alcanivorax sp. TaxID=1872427 RepID=UPI0039E2EB46